MVHYIIFFTNVLRLLEEQGLTKHELSARADVSLSFVSDITRGTGNPSIKVMEKIAAALETPLPFLLECTDMPRDALDRLAGTKFFSSVPDGYQRVSAVVSDYHAFLVSVYAEQAQEQLQR
ncbi:helix-turn-helix domain-containing protein [Azohydromonas lata]|uniref:Helix-turn-helix domain-containing protein n=1 Tax=Azohydromonas lata TaxID=45677 RepID=A0ABU5IK73_9BURK|nr:helix-turn-helix domain-containing protein [Azohydromonas lata]MDZ5459294.1 helix-turn-helix domain-containing protein [Azohydromonas lata]